LEAGLSHWLDGLGSLGPWRARLPPIPLSHFVAAHEAEGKNRQNGWYSSFA
jgi:hypothetical protein